MIKHDLKDYCGCCGQACVYSSLSQPWCAKCKRHVRQDGFGQPWDRTWFSQYGNPCPYEQVRQGER